MKGTASNERLIRKLTELWRTIVQRSVDIYGWRQQQTTSGQFIQQVTKAKHFDRLQSLITRKNLSASLR